MIRLTTQMCLCFCLVRIAIWEVDGERGSDIASCSCYSFHDKSTSLNVSKTLCQNRGGNLVSMETKEEWEFIKTQIQNRTTELLASNNWWIGLEKKGEEWKWLSNHTLTYDKWLGGEPADNEEKQFAAIVKEFNGTQGLFNATIDGDHKGKICEYHKTNCSGENELPWCKSTPHPVSPAPKGLNESILPRYPYGCTVIKKANTPVIIPVMVALAGLVVIVAINIIIIKWRGNAAQEPSKKREKLRSHSEQEDMDSTDGTVIAMNVHGSGIIDEESLQPRQDCIGKSTTNSDDGTNEIIDESCGNNKVKLEQPYYVNVQESALHTDTNGHYASVDEINETDGQKDSFVEVRTYSIVRNDDDGQTDDVNTSNYATVIDTLGTDRQTVTLLATESGYASVDVINNNSQNVPSVSSHHKEHDPPINAAHDDGSVQYAVIDIHKKNSKKNKARQPDNQNNRDDGHAPVEVIYDNCQHVPPIQEDIPQDSLENSVPNTGAKVEYAVVNKSMKKRNRSVKETAQPIKPTETSYASVDVEHCQDDSVPNTGAKVEYAVVNKSMKKRNRSVKETAQPIKPTETSYASVDVEHCQDDSVPNTGAKVEYAVVNKSMKKRNKSVKETAQPIKPTEISYVSVDVEHCQDDRVPNTGAKVEYAVVEHCQDSTSAPKPARRRSHRNKQDNEQHTQTESVSSTGAKVEYAAVDKGKKRNGSAKEAAKPNKPTETSCASVDVESCQDDSVANAGAQKESATVDKSKKRKRSAKEAAKSIKPTEGSYATVDVEHCQEGAPVPAQRRWRWKKDTQQHKQDGSNVVMDKSETKNSSVKEVIKTSEATEASYASVDVIYDNC